MLYHLGIYERPTPHGHAREHTWAGYLKGVAQPELKAEMLRYIEQMAATRRTSTVIGYCHSLVPFARYLAEHHPEVRSVADLRRDAHIEPYLVWNAMREWTPRGGTPQRYSARERQHGVLDVKFFFDTITEWGWAEAPKRRLLFPSDVPKRDKPLPRFIPQDQEVRLMAAIRTQQDPFQRYPLEILRATGLRIGELLNLKLDCVHQVPGQGPGSRYRSASCARSAWCRSMRRRWRCSTPSRRREAPCDRCRIPRPDAPPSSCSCATVRASASPSSAIP